jgi:membrane-bound lytic murein transglycosylase B
LGARYYLEAQRRFGVASNVLAAVNYVGSAFNKLRNASSAGAQGPMQFIPSTLRAYGLGGNVHDPHDAIIGAANYLHANGVPLNYRRAFFRYNPSGSTSTPRCAMPAGSVRIPTRTTSSTAGRSSSARPTASFG